MTDTVHLRKLIKGGGGGPTVAAYNKVDPINTSTVYPNFKGPFVTNQTYFHGEELWVKFSRPVYLTDNYITLKINDTGQRCVLTNTLADDTFSTAYNYRSGVFPMLMFQDWDPATLCYDNAPYYFNKINTDPNKDRDFRVVDNSDNNTSSSLYYFKNQNIKKGMTFYLGSYAERDGVTQEPKTRTMYQRIGASNFDSFAVPEHHVLNTIMSEAPAASPAPTTTTFKSGYKTTSPYSIGDIGTKDDYFVGWKMYAQIRDTKDYEILTCTDYVASSGVATFSPAASLALNLTNYVLLLWIPAIYGVRFMTFSGPSFNVIVNGGTVSSGGYPSFTWPGVSSIEVIP